MNVHRFTPGFEKTFLDGMVSFEMKIPFAVTLDSNLVQDGGYDLSHGEFGDVALTVKALLFNSDRLAIAGGLMVSVPTASDTNVVLADGTPLVRIENRSTHLAPFLGFLWTPNDRFFVQGFYQVDVEAGGCPVLVNLNDLGLQGIGTLHDTTYQYIDLGHGLLALSRPGAVWAADRLGLDRRIARQRLLLAHLFGDFRQLANRRFQQLRLLEHDHRNTLGIQGPLDPDLGLRRSAGRRTTGSSTANSG